MRRGLTVLLLALCAAGPLRAADFSSRVEQLTHIPVLQNAWWSGFARYTDGEELFSVNADQRMTPASTLKLFTTAAALDKFGPHHRFETRLYATTQPDENGVLHGDIYVQGGGDPALGSTRAKGGKPMREVFAGWTKALQKAGIKQIDGGLYADVSLFGGPSIPVKVNWENIGNYFAAPATALAINDNALRIIFESRPTHGLPAEIKRTEPSVPGLDVWTDVTTDAVTKKDNAYVYGAPYQYQLRVYGSIPAKFGEFSIGAALPDAPLQTLQWWQEDLQQKGISVRNFPAVTARAPDYSILRLLHTEYSPELKDIIYIVNKRSFNFYAEMLLRQLAVKNGQKGTVENGISALYAWMKSNGIATDNLKFYDGSGLSRDNLVSARTLVDVLNVMSKHPDFKWYYNSLATPDDRGDLLVLRRFLRPFKKTERVRVKGGTIDGVKAAAGYVTDEEGQLIAFALVANNLISKDESLYRLHENIIKMLLNPAQNNQ